MGWEKARWCLVALAVLALGLVFAGSPLDARAGEGPAKGVKAVQDKASSDYKMGEVTVQATKMNKEISQVTDAVTIIPGEEITLGAYTDFTDVLRYTPGIQFKRAGGPGQYVYTKLRGFSAGHITVLIDGMKINESTHAGTGRLFSKLDPFLIGRVEILRGPQAVLYGSDTTAGVISVDTKGGVPGNNFTLGGEYGTYSWKKGYAGFRGQTGGFRYSVNAIALDSDGVIKYEDFRNFSPQIKVGYNWHDKFDVEASYLHIQTKWNYAYLKENYSFCQSRSDWWAFQIPDPERWNKENYDLATVHFKHQISENLRQKLMVGWYRKKTESKNPYNGLLGYVTAPVDHFTLDYVHYYNKGQTVPVYDNGDGVPYYFEDKNFQADYNFIWDQSFRAGLNTALFGLEYVGQDGKKWGKYGDADGSLEAKSVYFNDQLLLLNEALVLNGGVRYDAHKDYGNQTNWKVGAAYTFHNVGSTLFANYGTSFRSPTILNLYDPRYGNPNLNPEKGWSVEGGLRQKLMEGRANIELTLWKTKLDDVIAYDYQWNGSSWQGTYVNRDSQTTQGLEMAFAWKFYKNFTLLGNYTYTDSKTDNNGVTTRTVQIARNTANLGVQYQLGDKLFLELHGYYSGPRLRWRGDVEMDSYVRVDFAGRYRFWDGLSVFSRVNNVFDQDIEEGLGYKQPGVYWVVGLEWDFTLPGSM